MKQTAPYNIIFENDSIIALDKASGIAVGGDRWDEAKERLDKLISAQLGKRLYTVHRIDSGTSGVVVFAKDEETHRFLSAAFENRTVEKRYIAVVHGRVLWTENSCDLSLLPNGDKQHRTIVDKYRGKKCLTRFRFLLGAGNYSVLEAIPETGRTHQIRVHLANLGHPIVCDSLYGKSAGRSIEKGVFLSSFKKGWRGNPLEEKPLLSRLSLHAAELRLPDYPGVISAADTSLAKGPAVQGSAAEGPLTETPAVESGITLTAPLARDMAALIVQMEKCTGRKIEPPILME
jgi:23S rRNA pseudouridine1911/1915/1917 synthase